jgi:hypothetical protein
LASYEKTFLFVKIDKRKANMLSRKIKNFYVNGFIRSDSDIIRLRAMHEKLLIDEMRTNGYVPVLDSDPQFSIKYNQEKDNYSFYLEIHGVYLGKRKAWEFEGFSGQDFIPR